MLQIVIVFGIDLLETLSFISFFPCTTDIQGAVYISNSTTSSTMLGPFLYVQQMLNAKDIVCAADLRYGCYLIVATFFRGCMFMEKVNEQILNVQNKSSYFIAWSQNCGVRGVACAYI